MPSVLKSLLLIVAILPSAAAAPLVALDVGHSRANPGAISAFGRSEFDFNVDLADDLHAALADIGIASVLIGRDGEETGLAHRDRRARELGATILLSVHHDSAQPQLLTPWQWQGNEQRFTDTLSGYSLFVSRRNPHADTSLRCARGIGSAMRTAGLVASDHHAARIAGEFKPWADRNAGVYYYDNLVVLNQASMPAVLLEAGVILNRRDAELLAAPDHRRLIARAVADGLAACLAPSSRHRSRGGR